MRTIVAVVLAFALSCYPAKASISDTSSTDDRIRDLAVQAYYYAYPLVVVSLTRELRRAPLNQFFHMPMFPPAGFRAVVRPNVDTLYSTAWLDLTREPVLLSVPDTTGRYYLMQMLDAWTETFALPGSRLTGSKSGKFLIAGPDWKGTALQGARLIRAPTNTVWLIGRTQTNGVSDYDNVHAIQAGYKLTELDGSVKTETSATGSMNRPGAAGKTPPQQVAEMDAATFFKTFASLLKETAPHEADAPLLSQLKTIGIERGRDFDIGSLAQDVVVGLDRGVKEARARLAERARSLGDVRNGWRFTGKNIGRYGTAYLERAAVAQFGLGALPPEEAIYPTTFTDDKGSPLNGANRYLLHFTQKELPPAGAFWSVTMYDPEGYFVPNTINRFGLGDRDKLTYNKDGSLDIYIQRESPGAEKQANWLPAPNGDFNLSLRLYLPKPEATDGRWIPPAVKRS